MTALDNEDNDEETVAAITYLLAVCIKRFVVLNYGIVCVLDSFVRKSSPITVISTAKHVLAV